MLADPRNYAVRANLMWCATQALNGLIGCGVPQDWASHMIGHELTALYGIDHAQSLAHRACPACCGTRRIASGPSCCSMPTRIWEFRDGDEDARHRSGDRRDRAVLPLAGRRHAPGRLQHSPRRHRSGGHEAGQTPHETRRTCGLGREGSERDTWRCANDEVSLPAVLKSQISTPVPMSTQPIHLSGAEFLAEKTMGLCEPAAPKSLGATAERSSKHNRSVTDAIPDFQDWREAAHQIKTYAIANLDKLLVEFERNMTARGATVLWAKDAAEANQHVLDIAREHNVKSVVKSKSMVSEEMELEPRVGGGRNPRRRDRPGRVHRAIGPPAAGPYRHAGHPHVGGRRGPAVCRQAGRAVSATNTRS